jgi:hypothetical protein
MHFLIQVLKPFISLSERKTHYCLSSRKKLFENKLSTISFFIFNWSSLATLILFPFNYRNDETRQPLSRKVPLPSSRINPYRMVIVLRLVVLSIFLHYRITNPVRNAYPLWLLSVICEIWFAISWILDQFPKWFPINRETYLDRLSLR